MDAVPLSQRLLEAARGGEPGIGALVRELAAVRPAEIEGDPARLAFWLNVYNARLLHALAEHPRSGHLFRHRGLFRSTGYAVGGREYTLDQIEHGLLRGNRRAPYALRRTLPAGDPRLAAAPALADPRIHFALNCGAVSCPPIAVYDEAGVEAQLEAAARAYLAAETRVEDDRVVLPGLMRLYRGDFDAAGGPLEFALAHLPGELAAAIRALPGGRVSWSRFDWTLVAGQPASSAATSSR